MNTGRAEAALTPGSLAPLKEATCIGGRLVVLGMEMRQEDVVWWGREDTKGHGVWTGELKLSRKRSS